MIVHLRHLLIADSIILDAVTNKASAIGLFDEIKVPADKDIVIANFSILGQLIFDELPIANVNVVVELISPNDVRIKSVTLPLETFPPEVSAPQTVPLVVNFNGTEISELGNYNIRIVIDGQTPEVQTVASFKARKLVAEEPAVAA